MTSEKKNKPRCVIVFDTPQDFEDMRNYAKTKGLDMKNFFMWLAKTHITKYPLKTASMQEVE